MSSWRKKKLTIMTGVLKQKVLIDNQSGLLMAMIVVTKMMIARPLMSLQNDDDVIEWWFMQFHFKAVLLFRLL